MQPSSGAWLPPRLLRGTWGSWPLLSHWSHVTNSTVQGCLGLDFWRVERTPCRARLPRNYALGPSLPASPPSDLFLMLPQWQPSLPQAPGPLSHRLFLLVFSVFAIVMDHTLQTMAGPRVERFLLSAPAPSDLCDCAWVVSGTQRPSLPFPAGWASHCQHLVRDAALSLELCGQGRWLPRHL